jgi:hypothetical protein
MNVEVKIIKDIPTKQIESFEDRVVYDVAVETREMTKGLRAYPYLSGELEREEIAEPVTGSNKEYSLGAGVGYASRVYNLDNVNWTNPSTEKHWYYTVFNKRGAEIVAQATAKALKEFKK